jgi:hypothetical protein
MRINYKTHALAISVISAVIVVIYIIVSPKTAPPIELKPTNRYVRIMSATWGENCNLFIEEANAKKASQGLAKDEHGNAIPTTQLKKVMPDNALEAVKGFCEGRIYCESAIKSATLGIEPAATCFKKLDVTYRCFDVDRLHTLSIDQNESLTIDCSKPVDEHAPASGN